MKRPESCIAIRSNPFTSQRATTAYQIRSKYESHSKQILFAVLAVAYSRSQARASAQEPLPSAAPSTSKANGPSPPKIPNGTVDTKYVELKQNGNQLTGHFKGPNQSGGLQGTVNDHHIFFRTKTREPLGFRGMVNGDTIEGTFHASRGTGEFHAYREGSPLANLTAVTSRLELRM